MEHATFSPDGRRIVTTDEDRGVRVWESATGTQVFATLHHREIVFYAAFSPDGRHLVTACMDRTVHVWDAVTGEPIGFPLKSSRELQRVTFRADGRQVIMIGKGGYMCTWDITQEKRPLGDLQSLAQVLASRCIGAQGTLMPLEPEQLHSASKSMPAAQSAPADAPGP